MAMAAAKGSRSAAGRTTPDGGSGDGSGATHEPALGYEDARAALAEVVAALESGDVTLEEALALPGVVATQALQAGQHDADRRAGEDAVLGGFQHVERLFVGEVAVVDDVDAIAQRALHGFRSTCMGGDPAADRMRGLHTGRDLRVGHDRGFGQRRFSAVVARDIELDGVTALAQAEPRHAPDLVRPIDGNAKTVLVQMQATAVAEAAGDGELRARREQPRTVGVAALDGVAHRDVEADLGRRRRAGAGETGAQ